MMAYSGGDEFPCAVAEIGSYATKIGFAGEDAPRSYFRSTTAIQRDNNGKGSSLSSFKRSYDFFTRPLENEEDGHWDICNPVDKYTGLVYQGMSLNANAEQESGQDVDMEGNDASHSTTPESNSIAGECYTHFSSHLSHGFTSALCADPSSMPLLLVERSYNPPPIRQRMVEILFEEHNVPATFLARDAVCACYAVGRTTGTVVDIGYSGTTVTPVFDGFVETKGILRSPAGSSMMEEMVLKNLDSLYKTKKARMKINSAVDYVMPLYQVRSFAGENHKARREPFHTLARLDFARMCMEDGSGAGVAAFGYASLQDLDDEAAKAEPSDIYQLYANAPKAPYKLPDGTEVDITQTKRFDVAELLFGKGGKSAKIRQEAMDISKKKLDSIIASAGDNDGDNGDDIESNAIAEMEEMSKRKRHHVKGGKNNVKQQTSQSHEKLVKACTPYLSSAIGEFTSSTISSMVCESAFKCDRDQQAQLLGNAVLCGGGACLSTSVLSTSIGISDSNAFPERLREEVEALIHSHTPGWRVKVLSPGISERHICSWLGASILGSLGSFHDMWITKAEYEEHGPSIVNRKCP